MVLVESSGIYIGALVMSIVSFLASCMLFETYHENELSALKNLAYFFLFYGIFQFLLGTRLLYMEMPLQEYHGLYIMKHIFLYVSLAHFSKFALFFFRSDWRKKVFVFNNVLGVVLVGLMYYIGRPLTLMIAIPSLFNWLVFGTGVFGWLALNSDGVERKKMLLMAAGVAFIAVSGPLHNVLTTVEGVVFVNFLTVTGTILALMGVYISTPLGE